MTTAPLFDYLPDPGALRYCDCCGDELLYAGGHYCPECAAYACDCADWDHDEDDPPFDELCGLRPVEDVPDPRGLLS